MLPALCFENCVGETVNVGGVARGCSLFGTRCVGEERVVRALSRRAVREIRFRDEVPAKELQQRIKECGARVGFLLLDEAGELLFPQCTQLTIQRLNFRGRRKLRGTGKVPLEVVRRKNAVAVEGPAHFLTREPEVELIRVLLRSQHQRGLCRAERGAASLCMN